MRNIRACGCVLSCMARIFVLSALAVVAAFAQTPVTFEVASVRPHVAQGDAGSEGSSTNVLPGGRLSCRNVNVRKLIRNAFQVEDSEMNGAPGWVDSASYDIEAKTTGGVEVTRDNIGELMEALLVSRFQLQYHREMRETTVFTLEVAKDGAKFKPSASDTKPSMSANSTSATVTLHASRISLKDFAGTLARQTGRPVVDQTGLAGEFDFDLVWSRDEAVDATAPSVFAALQGLGLRLVSGKGQVGIIVIDKVERPSEN
jgi:uncharacterized protein (TIGR03435 family)